MSRMGGDKAAWLDLHRERFPELPFDCGAGERPGIMDMDEWRDWSVMPTTPDQLRIEEYIDRYPLAGKAILHVGSGNSLLAARFAGRCREVIGTTVVPEEVDEGIAVAAKRGLTNYRVVLHNKHGGADGLGAGPFDFIVDNNLPTFCCCVTHLARMFEWYSAILARDGQIVTDRVGLGWISGGTNPRFRFDVEDLAASARLVDLGVYPQGGDTLVLARSRPSPPGLSALSAHALRRARSRALRLYRRVTRRDWHARPGA